ncbi:MAG: hypothetical protein E7316_08850 [Clostridiales bacterium]|nr:hypothetical protein [Clostridiales bacterium]
MERRRRSQPEQRRLWQDETLEDDRYYDVDPVEEAPSGERVEEILATNRTVMLTCTLAAMMPCFALFLFFAERKSRAIRHFAIQSLGLTVFHLALAALLLAVNALFGGIPYIGFLLNLTLWIVYISAAIVMLILRIRMMFFAWRGAKFTLPLMGHMLDRFN